MTTPNRTRIRLAITELTVEDGRVSGHASLSVTEKGQTRTVERQIGEPTAPRKKRSAKKRKAPTDAR